MQIVAQVRAGSGRFLEILVSSALKIFGAALEDVPLHCPVESTVPTPPPTLHTRKRA